MARTGRPHGTATAAVARDAQQVVRREGRCAVTGRVSLVGAGPGDPELWTLKAVRHLREADLVLYDALVDARALRTFTKAQCFCVGKRAGRDSVRQETIHRL